MVFEYPLPWWVLFLLVAAAAFLAYRAYARPIVPLLGSQRVALTGLRLLTLLVLIVFFLGPVVIEPSPPRNAVVPILIDASRSMRLADVDGQRRIDRAVDLARNELRPLISGDFQVEVLTFSEALTLTATEQVRPEGQRSDLTGALRAVQERYRGQAVAGVVVISDGGDTGGRDAAVALDEGAPPVYAVGVGARRLEHDREVLSVTVGEAALAESVVILDTSVVSHGFGTSPILVRVLEDGRPIQVRRATPPGDGSPVRELFRVSPKANAATLYTVEIPTDSSEAVPENNSRSILVRPPGRQRRLLLIEGAPGHEHSFLKRAWLTDPGIDLDSVVRKGQNDRGEETFYVQGDASRTAALSRGYPLERDVLFVYDAVVLGNIEADFFTPAQLAMTAEFVATRGGGLLVFGARSFAEPGFANTPLEEAFPVELSDRGRLELASLPASREPNKLQLTPDGETHPLMQVGSSEADSRRRWEAAPALAASVALGGPRPGASILAVTPSAAGGWRPLVAIQRYGSGRTMVFTGEAAWRWKMLLPSSDRTYEMFWRQAIRWLSTPAPDQVMITTRGGTSSGDLVTLDVTARDGEFSRVLDASITARVTDPGGATRELRPVLAGRAAGRYTAQFRPESTGVYHVQVEAQRGSAMLGRAEDWILVGGADLELADPRLNEEVLRRVATATGGRFLDATDVGSLPRLLRSSAPEAAPPTVRDAWHTVWAFLLVVALLSCEWTLHRRWGMR